MKKILLGLTLLASISSFAGFGEVSLFSNDSECLVSISKNGNWIVVNASKQVNGNTEQVQVSFKTDLKGAEIGSYCSEYDEQNATVTVEKNETTIRCINKKGLVKLDLDDDLNLTSFDFTGHHYYIFMKVDDSFSCNNLTRID